MPTIFHIATAADWAAAEESGHYTTSTYGRTLAEEGFIHASRGDQWPGVRERFYAEVTEPLVLLQIDTERLDVPIVDEPAPDSTETFPHIYGPLATSAVVKALPIPPRATRTVPSPTEPEAGAETATDPARAEAAALLANLPSARQNPKKNSSADFSSIFLREVFVNSGLALLALAAMMIGLAIGAGVGAEVAMLIGAVAGLAIGIVAASFLYRRRAAAQAAAHAAD